MTRLSSLIDKSFNTPYSIADNLTYYIPTNSIIMYSGASNPGLDSQGWTYISEYNGYYIQGNINGGTGAVASKVGGTGGVVTLSVGSAGSHTGNSVPQVQNYYPVSPTTVPRSIVYSDHSASGVHTHTAQAALDFTGTDINPPTRGWILLKSIKNTTVFPPNSILISGTQITGSSQLTGTDTYTYIKANSSPVLIGATQRSMGGYTASDIGTYNPTTGISTPSGVSIRPGWHTHALGTGPYLYGQLITAVGGTAPNGGGNSGIYLFEPYDAATSSPWPNAETGTSAMRHTHTLSSGLISCVSLTGKIVKLWQVAQYTVPESATVIMYSGSLSSLPRYWKVCDGTNGTINMNGYFLGYSNSTATAHDTTTTKNITSTSITFSTESWFHTHTGSAFNQVAPSVGWTFPVYHAAQNISHTHTISNNSLSADYTPPTVQLCFIQFTPDAVPSTAVNIPNIVSITPSASSVNEGSAITFTVNAWEANGYTLYWTVETNSSDFSITNGSFTITSNTGTFSLTPTIDKLTEGTETFTVAIRTGSISGPILATSSAITINDTSLTPTYSISTTSTIINEGTTVIYIVTTTNLPNGTILYYSNSGSTSAADFTDGLNSGSFTVTNNTATITKTLVNDSSYLEGSETLIIQLRTGSTSGTVVATASSVTVLDTNFATYAVTPTSNNVNEGSSLTLNATTQNVTDGTTLYWTINHTTTSTSDFSAESGFLTITSNSGSFSISTVADLTTESSETFTVSLRIGSITGTVVATTGAITVNDTSVYNGPQLVASFTSNNFTAQVANPFQYAKCISPTITLNPGELAIAFIGQIGNYTTSGNMTTLGGLAWTFRNGSTYNGSGQTSGATNGTNKLGLDIMYVYNNTASTIIGTTQVSFSSGSVNNGFWVVNTYSNTNQTTPFTSNLPAYTTTWGSNMTWQSVNGEIPIQTSSQYLKATTIAQLGIAAMINYSTNYSPPNTPSTWTEVNSYTGSNFILKVWNLQSPPVTGVNQVNGVTVGSIVGNSNWTTSGTYPWGLYVDSLNHT